MQLSHISMYISENKQSYVYRTIIDTCCTLLVPCPMLWCYHQQKCRVVALLLVLLLVPPIIVLLWYYKKYKPQAPIQVEFFTISGGGGMTMECLLIHLYRYICYICCATVYVVICHFLDKSRRGSTLHKVLVSCAQRQTVAGIGCE